MERANNIDKNKNKSVLTLLMRSFSCCSTMKGFEKDNEITFLKL